MRRMHGNIVDDGRALGGLATVLGCGNNVNDPCDRRARHDVVVGSEGYVRHSDEGIVEV